MARHTNPHAPGRWFHGTSLAAGRKILALGRVTSRKELGAKATKEWEDPIEGLVYATKDLSLAFRYADVRSVVRGKHHAGMILEVVPEELCIPDEDEVGRAVSFELFDHMLLRMGNDALREDKMKFGLLKRGLAEIRVLTPEEEELVRLGRQVIEAVPPKLRARWEREVAKEMEDAWATPEGWSIAKKAKEGKAALLALPQAVRDEVAKRTRSVACSGARVVRGWVVPARAHQKIEGEAREAGPAANDRILGGLTVAEPPVPSSRQPNPVCDVTELSGRLHRFSLVLSHLEPYESFVRKSATTPSTAEDIRQMHLAKAHARGAYQTLRTQEAELIFLGILQQYELAPRIRRRIEKCAAFFAKKTVPNPKTLEQLKKLFIEYLEAYDAASEAMSSGRPAAACATTRELHAGPFRLVNTGAFDKATMEIVKRVVEEAARRIEKKGLDAVLYGDINVSNTVSRPDVLAFYRGTQDEMFVRANVRGLEAQAMRTVIHELGHRYDDKVLGDKERTKELYRETRADDLQATHAQRDAERQNLPKVGDRVISRKLEFEVTGIDLGRGGLVVQLRRVTEPSKKAKIALHHYFNLEGPKNSPLLRALLLKKGGFVTKYASTNPAENFAEMFAFYCLDLLSPSQKAMFEKALKRSPAKPSAKEQAKLLVDTLGMESAQALALTKAKEERGVYWVSVLTSLFDLQQAAKKASS